MGKSKKKFIDRKKAVTFHLVHRSQHDPLITDENAPQHVLVEAPKADPIDPEKRRTDQLKFGIFFDDDYDYLQHLKQPGKDLVWEYVETPNTSKKDKKLQLPSSVFASEFEEDEGMLNKAAPRPGPRPDLDPDVIAALDDDFDFDNAENELEDDFFTQAMGGEDGDDVFDENEEHDDDGSSDEEKSIDSDGLMCSDDEEVDNEIMDRLAPLLREKRFSNDETKSRFTEFSMSSSVIRRNEQLTLLDDRFEKFYANYDDSEIGALDMEEIEGYVGDNHPVLMKCYREFKKNKQMDKYDKNWDRDRIKRLQQDEDEEEELVEIEVEDDSQKKKWDCESILSTYSNIYNHPKLIEEPCKRKERKIEIDSKTGMPLNVLRGHDSDKLTTKSLAKFNTENPTSNSTAGPKSLCAKSVLSTLSILSIREKDETPEEKRERKRLLKEYRAERRMEKKANAEAFKEEKKRQEKIKVNNANHVQGNRIL